MRIAALLEGDQETVLRLTDGLSGPVEAGARLQLELDRLDALETVHGRDAADAAWEALRDWVETNASAADRARAWQRRGCTLAKRGEVEATRRAFRNVLRVWELDGTSSTRAADAMFSLWQAESLLGDQSLDMVARGIAVNMRAAGAPSRADAFLHAADSLHLSKDLFRAHTDYWKSLALYHDAGDLHGVHIVSNRLADLYEESGRPEQALEMALSSGSGARAAAASAQIEPIDVSRALTSAVAPWQREAAYHVLVELGSRATEQIVSAFAELLLEDSALGPQALPSDRLPATALEALAMVALQVPDRTRGAAFERLAAGVHNRHLIAAGRACAQGLIRAGDLGMTDAADELLEVFLAGQVADYVIPSDAARLIGDDEGRRRRVVSAAVDGNRQAARALIYVKPTAAEIATWESVTDPLAREYVEQQVRIKIDLGDETQWSINMSARFEEGGLAAVYASPDTRRELLSHLLQIAGDDGLPESVRASAMRAVHPMLRVVDDEGRSEAADAALRLARGDYQHSPIESPEVDPLSNVQFCADTAGLLHAAALVALGIIEQVQLRGLVDELPGLIAQGLTSERPWVRSAALEVLGRARDVSEGIDLDVFVADGSPLVRIQALKAIKVREPARLDALLGSASADPDFDVRATVLALARAIKNRVILARMAEADEDAYLRGIADISLRESETSSADAAATSETSDTSTGT